MLTKNNPSKTFFFCLSYIALLFIFLEDAVANLMLESSTPGYTDMLR